MPANTLRRPAIRRAGFLPLIGLMALAACEGDSYRMWGWAPSQVAYSFPIQFQEFGRPMGGECNMVTRRADAQRRSGEHLVACHVVSGGQRINCSFFNADYSDFSEGRASNDERIRQACYHPIRMALFDQGEDPRFEDRARPTAPDRVYTPPPAAPTPPPSDPYVPPVDDYVPPADDYVPPVGGFGLSSV